MREKIELSGFVLEARVVAMGSEIVSVESDSVSTAEALAKSVGGGEFAH